MAILWTILCPALECMSRVVVRIEARAATHLQRVFLAVIDRYLKAGGRRDRGVCV